MQVKAIPAPDAAAPSVGSLMLADDENVRSLTAWQGGPEVLVTVPVSLELLQAACWADMTEDAGSVRDMTDDTVRSWAVSQLLTHGILGLDALSSEIAAQPPSQEASEFLAVIQERLPRALEPEAPVAEDSSSAEQFAAEYRADLADDGAVAEVEDWSPTGEVRAADASASAYAEDDADLYDDASGW